MWSMVTLVLNGAVFVMLGLEMPQVLQRVEGYSRWHLLGYVALLTLAVFALRMAWTLLLAWWSRRRQSEAGEGLPQPRPGDGRRAVRRARLAGAERNAVDPAADGRRRGAARPRPRRLPRGRHDRGDAFAQRRGDCVSEGRSGNPEQGSSCTAGRPLAIAKAALSVIESIRPPRCRGLQANGPRHGNACTRAGWLPCNRQARIAPPRPRPQLRLSMNVLSAQRHELLRLQKAGCARRHAADRGSIWPTWADSTRHAAGKPDAPGHGAREARSHRCCACDAQAPDPSSM